MNEPIVPGGTPWTGWGALDRAVLEAYERGEREPKDKDQSIRRLRTQNAARAAGRVLGGMPLQLGL